MKFAEIYAKNRDGKNVIIRTAQPADAAKLRELKISYIKDSSTLPLFEDEYRNDDKQEAEMIQRYLDEPNSILLVAEYNGELVGNIDLTGNQRRKLYHTGMVGMGIHNDWQNNGIGTLLLSNCIKWAGESSPLKIIWLEVYSTNKAGCRLYEKTGFRICGEIKNFFINADKITMVKHL
jgi:ribosomal protein S18 acetylase RimI-like enzyme